MRIYGIADIHGSQFRLNIVLDRITEINPDLVVVCGDITQFGPADVATNFLDQIPVNVVAVHGNIDPLDIAVGIEKSKAEFIHQKMVKKAGIHFIGLGGNLDRVDPSINIQVNGQETPIGKLLDSASVLVTHVPPFKTMDKVFIGHNAGNKDLRELVDRCHPRLVLCGHIHENPGYITIGETIVVNCSMGKKTAGACIDLNKSITVNILD